MNLPWPIYYRIAAGCIVFGILAVFGLRLLYRGLRRDIYDASGTPLAARSWFIIGGIVCLLPLILYALYLWRQALLVS